MTLRIPTETEWVPIIFAAFRQCPAPELVTVNSRTGQTHCRMAEGIGGVHPTCWSDGLTMDTICPIARGIPVAPAEPALTKQKPVEAALQKRRVFVP